MAIPPPRPISSSPSEAMRHLIVFRVLHEWFALPVQVVYRVIPMGHIQGIQIDGDISLTRYQHQDVLIINVQQRLFGEKANQLLLPSAKHRSDSYQSILAQRHLLLIHSGYGDLMGIPLDTPPALRRFPLSAFSSIPPTYLDTGHLDCVNALIVSSEQEPPVFLLNPDRLLQPPLALTAIRDESM